MTNEISIFKKHNQKAEEKSLEVCLREEEVQERSRGAQELFLSLQNELDGLDDLKDGLSYLDMKNDTLLSYMIDLCNIILRKVKGDTISGHASVERSVYYRVILEKIKAIDQRLAYQLNKVITMPDESNEEDQGVNVKNLDIDIGSGDDDEADDDDDDDPDDDEDSEFDGSVDEDDGSDVDDQDNEDNENDQDDESLDELDSDVKKSSKAESKQPKRSKAKGGSDKKPVGIYKPPKLRSVAYNEGGKKRRDHSDMYQDDDGALADESYLDSDREQDRERTRYEEENYTRLPDMNPKKAKRKLKAKEMASRGKKKFKGGGKGSGGKKRGGKW